MSTRRAFFAALISSFALVSSAAAQDWTPLVHDGFGSPLSPVVTPIVHFGDLDYMGTMEVGTFTGGRALRTADGVHWTPTAAEGFGNQDNIGIAMGAVFEGMLYATTSNFVSGGEIWRTSDGVQWKRVVREGFGEAANIYLFPPIAIADQLFVGTNTFGPGAQLWRSDDGAHWEEVLADGYGDPSVFAISGPVEFQGALYVGASSDSNPGQLFRSLDGIQWLPVGVAGFGDPSITEIRPERVFQGQLYASAGSMFGGPGQMWRTHDGAGWSPVTLDGFGNPMSEGLRLLGEHESWMYVNCGSFQDGARLLRTQDGLNFEPAGARAFGWPGNFDVTGLALLRGALTATTFNFDTGAQLWAMQTQAALGDSFCEPVPGASAFTATLGAVGEPALGSAGFRLDAQGCAPNTEVLFFYGVPAPQSPIIGGTLCVGAPRHNIPSALQSDADGRVSRFVAYDEPFAAGISAGGTGMAYQLWFRGPGPANAGFSNALHIVHRP